jgi:cytochrome c oxidase subunit 2
MRVRPPALILALVTVVLVLAPVALAGGNAGFAPPDSATDSGSTINDLWWIIIGILATIFILVEGALVWFLIRYRRRPSTPYETEGPQVHGNTRLELLWTVVPLLILVGITVVTIIKVPSVEAKPKSGDDTLVVQVAGHQFYWEYTYPNGVVVVDRLRLPVDRPVRLELVAYDVIHSWWVPQLTGKRDTIPGRTNSLTFEPNRTGTFAGQCAELCGVEHASMHTEVEVVPAGEFDTWLAGQADAQAAGTSDLGQQTWDGVCAKCHGLDGEGRYGPEIAGNSTLASAESLEPLLEQGQDNAQIHGYMPPVGLGWPDKQLDALIAYIASNPDLAPAGAAQGG